MWNAELSHRFLQAESGNFRDAAGGLTDVVHRQDVTWYIMTMEFIVFHRLGGCITFKTMMNSPSPAP